jgi:hypothetical protein
MLLIALGTLVTLVAAIARALAVDEVRGYIQRRIAARVDAIIASLPTDLQREWGDEWRAELGGLIATPIRAVFFARGLRRSAFELTRGRVAYKSRQAHEQTDGQAVGSKRSTELDFSDRGRQTALQEAAQSMTRAYEILRTQVGAPNLIDNAFLREAMICAKIGLIWKGYHSDVDAIDPKTGETVEIKSTRLVDGSGKIRFLTSHRTPARLRVSDYWLFSVFDDVSNLAIVYRCSRADMSGAIKALEEQGDAGRSPRNYSTITLDSIRATCTVVFQNNDFEEYEAAPGRWRVRRRSSSDTDGGVRWPVIPCATRRIWGKMRNRFRA